MIDLLSAKTACNNQKEREKKKSLSRINFCLHADRLGFDFEPLCNHSLPSVSVEINSVSPHSAVNLCHASPVAANASLYCYWSCALKEAKMFLTVSRLAIEIYIYFCQSLQESFQWQIQGPTPTDPSSSFAPRRQNGKYSDGLFSMRDIAQSASGGGHSNCLCVFAAGWTVNTWCSGRWGKGWTWLPRWNRLVCTTEVSSRK